MSNTMVIKSLAKVLIAAAWVDGAITTDELNSLKDLLFHLPGMTAKDWDEINIYVDAPVSEAERQRLVEELQAQLASPDERERAAQALDQMMQADGTYEDFTYDKYTDYIAEHIEPWTYLKFPYLKKVGWKGFVDGVDSGIYKATPLSRLNAADCMATPLANAEYKRFYETLGGKPVHQRLATHWARLIELLYAAERWV